jgi:hypothetical protein
MAGRINKPSVSIVETVLSLLDSPPPRRPLPRGDTGGALASHLSPPHHHLLPSPSPVVSAGQSPCGAGGGGALTPSAQAVPRARWGLVSLASVVVAVADGRRPGGLTRGARCDATRLRCRRARPRGLEMGPNGPDLGTAGGLVVTTVVGPIWAARRACGSGAAGEDGWSWCRDVDDYRRRSVWSDWTCGLDLNPTRAAGRGLRRRRCSGGSVLGCVV